MIEHAQLDFAACVTSGQVFRFREADGTWKGVDGGNVIEATRHPDGWLVSSRPDEGAWRRFLQIDVDLLGIQDQLTNIEPRMAPLIAAMPGLRTLRPQSAHETLVSFLCTPNNHMSRIVRMVEHLASQGHPLEDSFSFPSLKTIAGLSEEDLRRNGFGYRSRTIPEAARAIVSKGANWLESLKPLPHEDARSELTSIPGIGPKLADCICLFGLHQDAAVPIDTHVWKTAVDWYLPEFRGVGLTPARYETARRAFADRFGNLSGWAQQYVFYHQFLSYRRTKSVRSSV